MDSPKKRPEASAGSPPNFIRTIIEEHKRTGRFGGQVVTRFPPEPNGKGPAAQGG